MSSRPRQAGTSLARLGYVARGVFYGVLSFLVIRIATLHDPSADHAQAVARHAAGSGGAGGRQANAKGALALVSQSFFGKLALGVAAFGFFVLGVVRLWAAWRDREPGRWRRLTVAGQGLLYLALSAMPISYLAGNGSTGTEKQQHRTAGKLLGIPGGAAILVCIGIGMILICGWQIYGALKTNFRDGLDTDEAPRLVRRVVLVSGIVGITGRALVFLPIAVFLIVSAFTFDPRKARGIDGELLLLAGNPWGVALLFVIALLLAVFALYSLLEARYRDMSRSV